ncbi:MAG TPA: group III truncated hemoglobin [Burkholderiales bacterium]|nr:group III truncated hemoglobin [Burkholderiales bacterium]
MKDIANHIGLEKVREVVSDFYDRVQQHPDLATPFAIVTDWLEHKAHLAHFWWVTLGGKRYREKPYSVAEKHALAGFTPELLQQWLALFEQTLKTHLAPPLAAEWYERARHIGRSLLLMHEFRTLRSAGQSIETECR